MRFVMNDLLRADGGHSCLNHRIFREKWEGFAGTREELGRWQKMKNKHTHTKLDFSAPSDIKPSEKVE